MCIVQKIRHNERIVWQRVICQVLRKLPERHKIVLFAAVGDIRKIGKRIVPFHVGIRTASCVTRIRKAFGIRFERFSCGKQVAYDIVLRERATEAVVIGDGLTGCEHEIIADRRVSVREVLGGEAVFFSLTIEVRHGGTANHAGRTVVLFHNDKNVTAVRDCSPKGAQAGDN